MHECSVAAGTLSPIKVDYKVTKWLKAISINEINHDAESTQVLSLINSLDTELLDVLYKILRTVRSM